MASERPAARAKSSRVTKAQSSLKDYFEQKTQTKTTVKRKQSPGKVSDKKTKKIKTEISQQLLAVKEENKLASNKADNGDDDHDHDDNNFLKKIIQERTAVCESVAKFKFNKKRVRVITHTEDFEERTNGVLYWMSRDQRVQDNWAFLYAQRLAMKLEVPLYVCFCLVPVFLDATIRQFGFMMKGLAQVEQECRDLSIPFYLLFGEASSCIPKFLKENNIGGVVTDFSPLRTPLRWLEELKKSLPKEVPLCQVDAHNLVPCWEASPKLEYSARTIRGKIHNQLDQYLTEFPAVVKHPHAPSVMPPMTDWTSADSYLKVDRSVQEVQWAKPGTNQGLRMLESFCTSRLKHFAESRNNPTKDALSNLSPWLHFGQISAQRCILVVKQFRSKCSDSVNAYIEETVIRRELADNFCFYSENYDSVKGAHNWAQKTLDLHRNDKRLYIYSRDQLQEGRTHDDLWNAAQTQMVVEGKMHGFLRMYWAKKILEWTNSPEEALKEAIYLNDRYNLDGRDPNGYVGCMWSICGVHDQGWMERKIFGKIRYMSYDGCKRKFDVKAFVERYSKKK